MNIQKKARGFTVVELILVIVVIAILATITIVVYTNVQTNAKVAKNIAELTSITKALDIYQARNGAYPTTGSPAAWIWSRSTSDWVPGLAPTYMSSLPTIKEPNNGSVSSNSYGYLSNGTDYKLMIHADNLCENIKKERPDMISSSARRGPPCWAYGFWSSAASENW